MTWIDSLRTAVDALRSNPLRSVLTTLGIIIGVGAVIIMVSIGAGVEARVAELIQSLGSNLIIVLPGSGAAGGVRLGAGTQPTLTEDDAIAIEQEIPHVQVAAPSVRGSGQVVFRNLNWYTIIYGAMPSYLVARNWEIESGRAFSAEEVRAAAKVALLGRTVMENLFQDQDPLDHIIRIKRVPFRVIGTLKPKGQSPMGRDMDDVVIIPLSTAKKRVLGGRWLSGKTVSAIHVKAYDYEHVGRIEQRLHQLLRMRHRLRPGQEDDFFTRNLSQILEARAESSRTMTLMLAAVALVSLIVGGIGIMNIMLVSVTERTREIGIRMSVGARDKDILLQFLTEAIILCLAGGAIGVILGLGGSLAASKLGSWSVLIKPESVAVAFGFSAAVGVFFGFYPARKAARLDPIDALRHE